MAKKIKNKQKEKVIRDSSNIEIIENLIFYLLVFTIFIIPIYFNIKTYDQFELPKLTLLRILTSIMLGLWLIKIFEKGEFVYVKTPLDIPLLLWTAINIICTFISISPYISFRGEYENFAGSLTNINYVILYFIATHNLKTKKQFYILAISLLLSGFLVTLYGVAQFFGYDFIKWSSESVIKGRYFSSLGNPNFLGAFLIMILPVNIAFLIISFKQKRTSLSVFLFILFILIYIALFGTQSRGPFLGFVFSMLVFLFYGVYKFYQVIKNASIEQNISKKLVFLNYIKKYKIWIFLILIFLIISIILSLTIGKNATNRIVNSILHIKESLKVSRLHIWIPALKIIKDYPLLGTGVDTFKTIFPKYEGLNFALIDGANVSSRTAHNELLNIAATMGLIGLAIYLLLIYSYIKMCYLSFKKISDKNLEIFSISLFAAFVAYFIQNLFSFGVASINTTLYLIFAINSLIYNQQFSIRPVKIKIPKTDDILIKRVLQLFSIILSILLVIKSYNIFKSDIHYNRGKILGNIYNRWDLSVKEHEKSVKLSPNEVKYHVYFGLAYEHLAMQTKNINDKIKLIQKAIEQYKLGIKLNPGNAYYWGNLGRIYTFYGSINPEYYKTAIKYYKEAIKRAPITGLFYNNIIDVYIKLNDFKNAFYYFEKLKYCDKKLAANISFLFGNIFFQNRDLLKAEEYYKTAIELNPEFYPAYYNLGVTYASLKEVEKALYYLKTLLNKKPDFDRKISVINMINDLEKKIKK